MTKPQQPELRRSGLGATDQDSAKAFLTAEETPGESGTGGPTPAANAPEDVKRSGTKSYIKPE